MSDDRDVRDTLAQADKVPPVDSVPLPLLSLPPTRGLPYWNTVGLIIEFPDKGEHKLSVCFEYSLISLVLKRPNGHNEITFSSFATKRQRASIKRYEREMKKNQQSTETDPPVPRQYSLLKVAQVYLDFLKKKEIQDCPLSQEKTFIFLGEIPNMRGHCVVVGQKTGKVFSGYHIEDFIELTEDET